MIATIENKSVIALDTTEVVFRMEEPFLFIAGQYATITLPALKQYPIKEQFRDFSIASAPGDGKHITIVVRNSESLFKKTLLGGHGPAEIVIEGPKGIFTLPSPLTVSVVFIAGGIGVTPFLSMIRHLRSIKNPLKVALFYYNKSRESAPYLSELEGYKSSVDLISVIGMLTEKEIATYLKNHKEETFWYVAGPRGLVKTAREILTKLGVNERCIRSEEFSGYE